MWRTNYVLFIRGRLVFYDGGCRAAVAFVFTCPRDHTNTCIMRDIRVCHFSFHVQACARARKKPGCAPAKSLFSVSSPSLSLSLSLAVSGSSTTFAVRLLYRRSCRYGDTVIFIRETRTAKYRRDDMRTRTLDAMSPAHEPATWSSRNVLSISLRPVATGYFVVGCTECDVPRIRNTAGNKTLETYLFIY